jgi:hypothetical protein
MFCSTSIFSNLIKNGENGCSGHFTNCSSEVRDLVIYHFTLVNVLAENAFSIYQTMSSYLIENFTVSISFLTSRNA